MKIAVVTGAGRGLGHEIAKGLASKGFAILATDIDEQAAAATANAIDEIVETVRANEVPVEYVIFPDEGHGFRKRTNRITASEAYVEVLDTYLNPSE